MREEAYPLGFEDLWRQMGAADWTCAAQDDATVRITAEGVEMTYAAVPADDPEVFALAAIAGTVEGRDDEGAVCEDALAANATGDLMRSLTADGQLKVSLRGSARQNFTAERLRGAIRAMAADVRTWKTRLEGGVA